MAIPESAPVARAEATRFSKPEDRRLRNKIMEIERLEV